jgi:tartronate-semialdehyde synthase
MARYSVPVVVEFILERVTNIAMGTEIDNIVEFEEILDLPLDDMPTSPVASPRGRLVPV